MFYLAYIWLAFWEYSEPLFPTHHVIGEKSMNDVPLRGGAWWGDMRCYKVPVMIVFLCSTVHLALIKTANKVS